MKKSELFWQTYLQLEKELIDISKYIFITDVLNSSQLNVYSARICDLLVRTCVEIEAISKELYFEFGGTKNRGDKKLMFDTDCLKLIDQKCETHKKVLSIINPSFNLTKSENVSFKPLKEAHKQGGTDWERAYQAVKHDRYESLSKGTIQRFIHALGALYLLNLYYRSPTVSVKNHFSDDFDLSFGSTVFAVAKPDNNNMIDVINNKLNDDIILSNQSPFIFKYTDASFRKIKNETKQCNEARANYIFSQPEFRDPEFIKIMKECLEKEKIDKNYRFLPIWEIHKYRLNKKILSTLPFEERKRLFIISDEFNGEIRKNNKHLKEEEITPENIQNEINLAGELMGMQMERDLELRRMQLAFYNAPCELVIDKGNVHYPKL